MFLNKNCIHFLAYKPCKFHKIDGRPCDNCNDYYPVKHHILIIKLDALGDVLRTTSILPALHKKYENASITWITKKNALDLFHGNPLVHRAFPVESDYLKYLMAEKFDVGICLDAHPESASILSIANCKEKLGYIIDLYGNAVPANKKAEDWYFLGVNDKLKRENRKTYQQHIYEICDLPLPYSNPMLFLPENLQEFAAEFFKKHQLGRFKKIIGINTGGGNRWQYKKWILEYYPELIKRINKKYPDHGIILFGGPEEIEFNKAIVTAVKELVIDAGCGNSLLEFASLINLTSLFLTPDSLGMHISISLKKITLVTVGPTSPWELDIYGNGDIIYNHSLECISCYKSACDFTKNCMNTLTPDLIFTNLEKYL